MPLALHVTCLLHTYWNHMFICSTNHQIQRSTSMKLAWHNWWSHICCGLYEDLCRHSSLFSSCIRCFHLFGLCLRVTTLTHSCIFILPLLFSSSDSLYPFHVICIPHTLVSQPPFLLTRVCTLIRRNCEPQLIKLEVQVVIQTVDHYNYS